MVQFFVRTESLIEVAGQLGSAIALFDGNMAAVESQVNGAHPSWRGDDEESFFQNWKTFTGLADAVRLSLSGLQLGLMAAASGYDTTELGIRKGMNAARPNILAIRKYAKAYSKVIRYGESRAEDMAEFFGRDYAGDKEKERFGGGAVRGAGGRYTGGGNKDTDHDGDKDGISSGPFLSQASVDELNGVEGADGGEKGPLTQKEPEVVHLDADNGDSNDGHHDRDRHHGRAEAEFVAVDMKGGAN